MIFEKITNGIKVIVKPEFLYTVNSGNNYHYTYSYDITIHNFTDRHMKLYQRCWEVIDSLNDKKIIKGIGVVGETPILIPNTSYNYTSNCILISPYGAMKGTYSMIDQNTSEIIKVEIPTFQLNAKFKLN